MKKELMDKLYPFKKEDYETLDIDLNDEVLKLLTSIDAERTMLNKYSQKTELTLEDLEEIQELVDKLERSLRYDEKLSLTKIKSQIL